MYFGNLSPAGDRVPYVRGLRGLGKESLTSTFPFLEQGDARSHFVTWLIVEEWEQLDARNMLQGNLCSHSDAAPEI